MAGYRSITAGINGVQMRRALICSIVSCAVILAGCSSSSRTTATSAPAPFLQRLPDPPRPPRRQPPVAGSPLVKHVVVIMQENRSFDNLFNGFPGADTVSSGNLLGHSLPLQPLPLGTLVELDHTHTGWWADWDNGKMDNFNHGQTLTIRRTDPIHTCNSQTWFHIGRSRSVIRWATECSSPTPGRVLSLIFT